MSDIVWTEKVVPVDSLIPYERNPRIISDEALAKLKESIQLLGYHQRVLATPDLKIIGGHQRKKIFKELGIENVAVLIPSRELTVDEFRQILITDNLPFGDFNWEMVGLDFKFAELKNWGMSADMFAKIKRPEPAKDPDEVPPVPTIPVSRLGDIWLLGDHRLMCADSTDPATVTALMNGATACLMQTDPPYGIAYVQNAKTKGQSVSHEDIENDELDGAKLQEFLEKTIRAATPHLTENAAFYLWHPMLTQGTFFAAADILIHRQII